MSGSNDKMIIVVYISNCILKIFLSFRFSCGGVSLCIGQVFVCYA